jgi:plastocyanin
MNRFRGRRRLLGLLASAALLSSASMPVALAASESVDEVGTSFQPAQVEISVGDTVVWTNRSNTSHSVAIDGGPDLHPTCTPGLLGPVGECQDPGDTARYTFTVARSYSYRCKLHRSMQGVVVVSPASTSSSATTSTTLPRQTTTSSTVRATTSSTTVTTRPLATSSTIATSSTTSTTEDTSSVLLPGDPPAFGDDTDSSAAGRSGGSEEGSDTGTVALIVALLLAISAAGGYVPWRLRPGRA